ncbi:DUF4307 domain-containing protein [Aquipuribacter sp. SD81]|uniref:DUF4307 domain-containing protein n=1 Tax=Aquipuribacter sp. SD81 TaxID=3127703 RepID=UPI003017FEEE
MTLPAPSDDVAARYAGPAGPRRGRLRTLAVVLGLLVVAAVVASLVASLLRNAADVTWRDVSFEVVDARTVRTTFEVYAEPGDRVRCQVRAADARYTDVGQVDVDLGPLQGRATSATATIRTTHEAVSSSVRTCVRLP